jgi:hypothetical protein
MIAALALTAALSSGNPAHHVVMSSRIDNVEIILDHRYDNQDHPHEFGGQVIDTLYNHPLGDVDGREKPADCVTIRCVRTG